MLDNLGHQIKQKYPTTKNKTLSFLLTKYDDGKSYCPPHSDDEPTLSPTDHIFTFSLLASRTKKFDSINTSEAREVTLSHNSLLVCSRQSQSYWKHSIPVDVSSQEPRYSITVRILEPFNVNSTYLYGDSNTAFIKFGEGPKTLGQWCPGEQIRTPRVRDLPDPINVPPVRNIIVHTGINDLRDRYSPLCPMEIVQTMESKCAAIHRLHPQMRIFLSPLLPTRDEQLNNLVRETNGYIYLLSKKHINLFMTDNKYFADNKGFLRDNLASRRAKDTVHLNRSRIIQLSMLFKSYATSKFICGNIVERVNERINRIGGVNGVYRENSMDRESVNRMRRVDRVQPDRSSMNMMVKPPTASNPIPASPQQILS